MSADEAEEPSAGSSRGVELFIAPYEGQDVYFDEELNMYRLKKRWPHQNTQPPRFRWTNEQWRKFRRQQQRVRERQKAQERERERERKRERERPKGETSLLPVVYQRPPVPLAEVESNPDNPPSSSETNQMASYSDEEQPLNSPEQPPISPIEWQITDAVDEVLTNAFGRQSPGSCNEKQSTSYESDHVEESSSYSDDCQSPTSFYQLQDYSTELHSPTSGDQMSPTLANEHSPKSYEWQYSDPDEESSTNISYYQPPDSSAQLHPFHIPLQCLEAGEMIPNTTTDSKLSSSAEEVLHSSTKGEFSNPDEQQLSSSDVCISEQLVPNSTKEPDYVPLDVLYGSPKAQYSNYMQHPSSTAAWVPEQIISSSTRAKYTDTAEQHPPSSAACVPEQVQSSFQNAQYSNLAHQESVPQQIFYNSTKAEYSNQAEQKLSSSEASMSEQVPPSCTEAQYSDIVDQKRPSSPDTVPLEVLFRSPKAQNSNYEQDPSSIASWLPPNSHHYVPYNSSHWLPVTTHHTLSGTAEGQPAAYAFTDWQLSGWNGQQPYIPVQQQQTVPVQQQPCVSSQQQMSTPVQEESMPVQKQPPIPVEQPVSNFGGQQVLWPVPNIQAQMYSEQQAPSSSGTLHTHHCLNGYPHKLTPCCVNGHHPPTPAPVSAVQNVSQQNHGVTKPVYQTDMENNQTSCDVQQQVGSSPAAGYPLKDPIPVPQPPMPPQEWLEWWLKELCRGKERKEAGTPESPVPETNTEHPSTGATSQERSSFHSEELPSEDTGDVGKTLERKEIGANDTSACVASVPEGCEREQKYIKKSQNGDKSECAGKEMKSDQHQGDKEGEWTQAKKSKKKRHKHKKKEQVQKVEPETSQAEIQRKTNQEQSTRSNWKKWKRNRAENRAQAKQPLAAPCTEGVHVQQQQQQQQQQQKKKKKKKKGGRWQRDLHRLPEALSASLTVKDTGGDGNTAIELGGPTPQESARRPRRRPPTPPPPPPPAPRHADADVDWPRPAARCSRCSSESPPTGLCYRCCCLGAASRRRQAGSESGLSADTQELQAGPQTVRVEAAAELGDQNDAGSTTVSQGGTDCEPQQRDPQHKLPTPCPQTGLEDQKADDIQVSRDVSQERNS